MQPIINAVCSYVQENQGEIASGKKEIYRREETGLERNFQVIRSPTHPLIIVIHFKNHLGQGAEKRAKESVAFHLGEQASIPTAYLSVPKFYRDQKRDPMAIRREIPFYKLMSGQKEFLTYYGASTYKTSKGKKKIALVTERGRHFHYGKPIGPLRQNPLAFDLMNAVIKLHSLGIIHFDLTRRNLLETEKGLKLFDFGTAEYQDNFSKHPKTVGTPTHLAPEMHQAFYYENMHDPRLEESFKAIGYAVDDFAVGVILWGMKHGEEPSFISDEHCNAGARVQCFHLMDDHNDPEDQILKGLLHADPIHRIHLLTAFHRFKTLGNIEENLV